MLSRYYLYVLSELVVAVDVNGREFSDVVEFKFDFERMSRPRVVLPANPSLISVVVVKVTHFNGLRPDLAVCQLSQTAKKLSVPITIVSRVEEFPIVALVTLRH